ncbi:glycosyltransferase [Paractinoplanes deccanensis]|uniref:glycosyltransferase n=1 Tax=Paractinoplanes deccanensis TaxID=113561 RepID=UPI00194057C1|nr:glycosyltransferase [Actinoplanes deccanensis]
MPGSREDPVGTPAGSGRIAVIVPTRHEADSVGPLYHRLRAALNGRNWEIVFVDDSDDETPARLADLAGHDPRVAVVHRAPDRRPGGLGGAVLAGFAATEAGVLAVMDADMQHPPEALPRLVDALASGPADLVVGTRYRGRGSAEGLNGSFRHQASRACRRLVHAVLPRTRVSTDPLGGFFALRREVVDGVPLRPIGYKILLEILVRGRWNAVDEVEYTFRRRFEGASKSGLGEARRFLRHVVALRRAAPATPARPAGSHRPLRVLIFTSEVAPVVSGIATSMGNLSRSLTAAGHQVDVVSRADFPRLVHREVRLSGFARSWPRFRRRLSAYDVVNVHGPVPTMSDAFLLLAATMRRRRRPAVVYTHHSDLAIPGLRGLCALYNRMHRRVAQLADVILVSSAEYRDRMHMPSGPHVEIIPWGVDTRRVLPRPPRPPGAALRVLFVGQLRPYKGAHILLDAAGDLPGVTVTLIGDGPERPRLEARAAGLPAVTFRGRVSDADLWHAYSTHDVIVLPSLTTAEAYGLVLGEGMASGCVPVASDLPGVREVAGPSGLLVAPGDAEALRDALKRLSTDDALLDRLARASLERGLAMSVEAATTRHDQVFRHVLDHTGARRTATPAPRTTHP